MEKYMEVQTQRVKELDLTDYVVAPVCFLMKEENGQEMVLLGLRIKEGGLGEGNYSGIGGKLEEGESEEEGLGREIKEEIGVSVTFLERRGEVIFTGRSNGFKMRTPVYVCTSWEGDPTKTSDMDPVWIKISDIDQYTPKMFDDNKFWVKNVLCGGSVHKHFIFGGKQVVEQYDLV